MTRALGYVCLTAAIMLASIGFAPANDLARITMLPSQTKVGMAKVTLLVSDLAFEGDVLVGTYQIKIPLAPWRNDVGELRLFPDVPFLDTLASGGVVNGNVLSHENGRTHPVTCRIEADGTVNITVQTHERTLAFKTRVGAEF